MMVVCTGNAGVHLCHAMSYPISSCIGSGSSFSRPSIDYAHVLEPNASDVADATSATTSATTPAGLAQPKRKKHIVPHGLSVVLTAPAVFRWTCAADPDRHLRAAQLLGADTTNVRPADAGLLLADTLCTLLQRWSAFVPNGLGGAGQGGLGYSSDQLDVLVRGTLPQRKVIDVAPRQPMPEDLHMLLSQSMKIF